MSVVGIVLAAGASRRLGAPKALARLSGRTFIEHTLAALGPTERQIVVLGAPHASAIERELGAATCFVHNPDPSRGMLSSLQVGLAALPPKTRAVVVALIDHPRVSAATVAALIEAWRSTDAALVRPRSSGRSGHPIVLDRALFEPLQRAEPSAHLGRVLAGLGRWWDLEVADPGVLDDFDTPDSIARAS
jgi:molybdenum cofactor cytidylyltransferase